VYRYLKPAVAIAESLPVPVAGLHVTARSSRGTTFGPLTQVVVRSFSRALLSAVDAAEPRLIAVVTRDTFRRTGELVVTAARVAQTRLQATR
jgi:hypothetical protein